MTDLKVIDTDVLIIGGGTAGCYAARELSKSGKFEARNPLFCEWSVDNKRRL